MRETTPFSLETPSGHLLHGLIETPEPSGRRPAVVIAHGFKGFMEWGFFPHLAELLTLRGFTVVRFNFSGAGMRPGDDLVTDPAAFRGATFSDDLEDLLAVLGATGSTLAPDRVDPERIGLVGHSRGGGAAVLAAADPEWRDRLGVLVTWAGVSTFDRVGPDQKRLWRERGELPIANGRTGQELPVGLEVLEDLEAKGPALAPLRAAAERKSPWLIVHGSDDETVPVAEAEALADRAHDPTELLVVAGGSHTFGAVHPFAGPTPQLIEALNATQTWLRRFLS